ncbi:preprotein translocase subunit SecE [Legionella pneumophila]|nr:preprotein translocase subunit SecE [Legionella pneumophila]
MYLLLYVHRTNSIDNMACVAYFDPFLGYLTTTGKRVFAFAQEAKVELLKVVWPTRQETIQTTTIVMVMVGLTGFILWGVDSIMMWAIAKLTHLG